MNINKIFLFLRRRWVVRFLFLLSGIIFIAGILYGAFFFQSRKADKLIVDGHYTRALKILKGWTWLPLASGSVYERIGTAELLFRGRTVADSYFRKAEAKIFSPVPFWKDVLKGLWTNARYEDGLLYVEHIGKKLKDESVLRFYQSGFLAGTNQLELAQKLLPAADASELATETALLKSEIQRRLSTHQYTFLYDRKNFPLVSKSFRGDFKILYDVVQPVLRNPSGDYVAKLNGVPNQQANLTLDFRIQHAAQKALGKYAGAIVLLDVEKGDILAAASSSTGHNSNHQPGASVALHHLYEPGSIIKMITMAGAIESGSNPQKLFPMNCEGSINLSDNKVFYCWKAHEQMLNAAVATAVSCNVAFAKIGFAMKQTDLLSNLRNFGFDKQLRGDYLTLPLGKIIKDKPDDHYIAKLSIGLDYLKMTPLHAAMVAAAIANEGVSMKPRLLLHYRNVIGIPYSHPEPSMFGKFMSKETADALTEAMRQVIVHHEGTGRRAAVKDLPIAMKTGTAGKGATGYDAILIGFVPVEKPKVAFAVVAEHSGKAEFEGSRITKLFLESIQGYIQ